MVVLLVMEVFISLNSEDICVEKVKVFKLLCYF